MMEDTQRFSAEANQQMQDLAMHVLTEVQKIVDAEIDDDDKRRERDKHYLSLLIRKVGLT